MEEDQFDFSILLIHFRVLGALNEVNVLNSKQSLLDLAVATHVQQTACFEFYGKRYCFDI